MVRVDEDEHRAGRCSSWRPLLKEPLTIAVQHPPAVLVVEQSSMEGARHTSASLASSHRTRIEQAAMMATAHLVHVEESCFPTSCLA